MKKYALAAALALSTLGVGSASNAAVINAQISNSNIATNVTGLTSGQLYRIIVSGTVGITGDRVADAEFQQRNGALGTWDDRSTSPSPTGTDIGVAINGLDVTWRSVATGVFGFNPAHSYFVEIIAASTSMTLLFRDSNYGDNPRGQFLSASITAVPLPAAGFGLLAGLAGLAFLRRRKTA